jgi:hypothetical protein
VLRIIDTMNDATIPPRVKVHAEEQQREAEAIEKVARNETEGRERDRDRDNAEHNAAGEECSATDCRERKRLHASRIGAKHQGP